MPGAVAQGRDLAGACAVAQGADLPGAVAQGRALLGACAVAQGADLPGAVAQGKDLLGACAVAHGRPLPGTGGVWAEAKMPWPPSPSAIITIAALVIAKSS